MKKYLSLLALLLLTSSFVLSQVKVSGYSQFQYKVEFKDVRTETFSPGTINLKFRGDLSKYVKWELQFGVKEMSFNKFLKDYFIEFINPIEKLEGLELKLGQFKYYWSIERKESSSDRKTMHRSQVVSALVADRDRGMEISYTGVKNLRIALGFWNGEVVYKDQGKITETIDYTRNLDDSDAKKDITGYAGYTYEINKGNLININASYLTGSNGKLGIVKKTRAGFGFDGYFINKNLQVRSEFITGKDDDVKKEGYYVQASYRIFDYLEPVIKYESWDSDKNKPGKSDWLTLGLFSRVDKVVFRLNYVMKKEKGIREIKNDELLWMIQVKF